MNNVLYGLNVAIPGVLLAVRAKSALVVVHLEIAANKEFARHDCG